MSAAFKIAKRKYSQNDIRKLMNDQKSKIQAKQTKIDSPLAKYDEAGQLTCILCKSIVRSHDVWKVHVNAKQHKENIALAKKLKEKTQNFTKVPTKRPPTPPTITETTPSKKIKSILKNSFSKIEESPESSKKGLPYDFFDQNKLSGSTKPFEYVNLKELKNENHQEQMDTENKDDLPEGFFDDPKMDAKVRNLEYKDPIEEEWEKFKKEMKEEASVSNAIIAEDQEEATTEREIDEIDEQMRNWSRVLNLEKKKQEVNIMEKSKHKSMEIEQNEKHNDDEEENDNSDDNFDEFLDWRAKKSHR